MDDRFVRRVAIAGLSVIFLLGLLLSFITSAYVRNKIVNLTGEINALLLENTIDTRINPTNLVNLESEDNFEVELFIRDVSQTRNIKVIKVWDTKGRIVHSTIPELEGKKFPLDSNLKKALSGQINCDISKLDKENNFIEKEYYKELYEVFIPIHDKINNRVIGVFEVYWDTKEFASTFTQIYYFVLAILIIGFVVTYLGTYVIMKKLVSIIKEKDLSIGTLTRRLEDTKLIRAYTGTIQSLLTALDAKDKYTAGHSIRVADYAIKIASTMGMDEENIKLIEEAALFHDIGKIAVPERILKKTKVLTEDEYDKVKQHPVTGEQIIRASGVLDKLSHIIRSHHERIDGHGYPDGLNGDAIPLEAQILAVADTFDALTSNRPYRKARSFQQAIKILQEVRGSQLNTELVDIFIEIIKNENGQK